MKKALLAVLSLFLAAVFVMPAFSVQEENALPFKDVKKGDWFYSYVEYVYENGIMKGTAPDKFSPDTQVTRAMFVTMLGRLWGAEEYVSDDFSDVDPKSGSWYAGYVGWAAKNGIVSGYPGGVFRPGDSITREQMAAIISRFIDYSGIVPLKSYDPAPFFTDEAKISSYARENVEQMRVCGIIAGMKDGSFSPKGSLTRAQAATVMMRLSEMISYLRLGEPNEPDYTVDGFVLMSAWDLYYSGTALGTSYEGIGVFEADPLPYLAEDEDGLTFYFAQRGDNIYGVGLARRTDPDEMMTAHSFSVDAVMDRIDIDKYPVIRFGFSVPDGAEPSFHIWSDGSGERLAMETGGDGEGWQYGVVDLSAREKRTDGADRISLGLNGGGALKLRYFAAFESAEAAEAFDFENYADRMRDPGDGVVPVEKADDDALAAAYAEADAQTAKILASGASYGPDDVKGTCYYISSVHGDDNNDGKSPSTPWRSLSKLYRVRGGDVWTPVARTGDGVFFECGSEFIKDHENKMNNFLIIPGILYGSYGEGEKPLFSNRLVLDGPAGKWKATEWPNVWQLDQEIFDMPGNITFVKDGVELWGVFVVTENPVSPFESEKSIPYGWVWNGEEKFESGGVEFKNPGALCHNLEYVGDKTNGGLWVYCDRGNPGEVFDKIVISRSGDLTMYQGDYPKTTVPTRLDNLAFKYTGGLAVNLWDAENVFVTNCVFEWIGGQYQDDTTRFGNAVQNWGSCDGVVVKDCYFKDIYDAAVTTQGHTGIMHNFYSTGCVLDRCDLSYEFFINEGWPNELINIFITDNYVINNGVGFCDIRTDRRSAFLYTSYGVQSTIIRNFRFENNVNILSTEFALVTHEPSFGKAPGLIAKNNVYFMDPDASFFISTNYNLQDRTGYKNVFYPFTSQYLTYLSRLGFETGSRFYAIKNPVREG